jgi:hypothetical protein
MNWVTRRARGGPRCVGELLLERHRGGGRRQLAVALWMPGKPDGADAVRLEQSGFEQRCGPGEGAAG